jgi:hypothetical protein
MFRNDKNQFGFFFLGHFTSLAVASPKACLFSLYMAKPFLDPKIGIF